LSKAVRVIADTDIMESEVHPILGLVEIVCIHQEITLATDNRVQV